MARALSPAISTRVTVSGGAETRRRSGTDAASSARQSSPSASGARQAPSATEGPSRSTRTPGCAAQRSPGNDRRIVAPPAAWTAICESCLRRGPRWLVPLDAQPEETAQALGHPLAGDPLVVRVLPAPGDQAQAALLADARPRRAS